MKQAPTPRIGSGPTQTQQIEGDDAEELLSALEDEDCRSILDATADDSLSASELSETCELPLSTTYRKVDILTEAGLLEEQIRLSTSGKHTSEYALCVEDIHLSFGGEAGIELEVTEQTQSLGSSLVAGAD